MFGFKADPAKDFWKWIAANLAAIQRDMNLNNGRPSLDLAVHELGRRPRAVNSELVHEIGRADENTVELVISADGIKANFPAVIELVKRAPTIPNLKITAFKPRVRGDFAFRVGEVEVDDTKLAYRLHPDGQKFGLELYVDANLDERMRGTIGFIALDAWLGEYDVATGLSWIEFKSDRPADARPISELPGDFDSRRPQPVN